MSTLILRYAREHNMGKYTLVASNQLGTVESNCDLIVRKKQFPPVFWQRLYNVSGQADSTRFVGGVEVGGWPVPTVYWYRVLEDGEEVEVTTRTHTENWNGNPNKYVPSSKVEIRQIDQIRHCIIFNQVGEGYSGLYRVRAVNCLGEAECEAELSFDGEGGGDEMYLPPLWREKRRLTWRDEDLRKKPFVGFNEPELSPEELEAMKKGSGLVPLSRITEYLASLPDYVPGTRFNNMERMPFKAGVDEHDYRPSRKGGSPRFPGKFEKGKIVHRNYNVDGTGRILPLWQNMSDPRARDSSDWRWTPVHPDLYEPQFPPRARSPEPTPVWEKPEDISRLIKWLRSLGCRVTQVEISASGESKQQQSLSNITANTETVSHSQHSAQQSKQAGSAVKKFSYIRDNTEEDLKQKEKKQAKHTKQAARVEHNQTQQAHQNDQTHQTHQTEQTHQIQEAQEATKQVCQNISVESQSTSNVTTTYETRTSLQSQQTFQESESEYFTAEIAKPIYHKQENLSFPELDRISQPPPALPPKTKIMHSPSRKPNNKLLYLNRKNIYF